MPRENYAPPRTFFHSERPRHSRRLRPISYLGAARFTVTVFRAPCAGRVRALASVRARCEPPDAGRGPGILDTRRLCQSFSRVPPSPTGTSTGTYRHAAARRRQGTAAGTAGHASKRGKANALYRSISLAAAPRSCMRLRLWQFRP